MNSATSAEILPTPRADHPSESRPQLDGKPSVATVILFGCLLIGGLVYTALSLSNDGAESGARTTTYLPFLLLGVALLIALCFEFVNRFHDTAIVLSGSLYWLFTKIF